MFNPYATTSKFKEGFSTIHQASPDLKITIFKNGCHDPKWISFRFKFGIILYQKDNQIWDTFAHLQQF